MACVSQWGEPCSPPYGFCSNESICECLYPSSPVGDFAPGAGEDCMLDHLIIRAFWVASATLHGVSCVINVAACFLTVNASRTEHLQFSAIAFFNGCFVLLGGLKGAATTSAERSIGIDPLATAIFVIGGSCYWMILEFMFYNKTKINPTSIAAMRMPILSKLQYLSVSVQLIVSTSAFLILFGMIGDPKNSFRYAIAHYLLLGFLIVVVCSAYCVALQVVIAGVKKAMSTNLEQKHKLSRVLYVFQNMRAAMIVNIFGSSTIALAFAVAPKLIRLSSYFLPILWSYATLPLIAYGASAIAVSGHRIIARSTIPAGDFGKPGNNSLPARALFLSTPRSTPGARKRLIGGRKRYTLPKVEETLISSSEDGTTLRVSA